MSASDLLDYAFAAVFGLIIGALIFNAVYGDKTEDDHE